MITSLRNALFATAIVLPTLVAAQADIRQERVNFNAGTTGAMIEGSIKGYDVVDYLVQAKEGQLMDVSMATDNTASYFNILAPGEDSAAFFIGSVSENQYEGALTATGDYKLRVYMMRSAARRDEVANFKLDVNIAPVSDNNGDPLVEGTDYHATGAIACAFAAGQPLGHCEFGVRRQGGGTGIVNVTRPDGSTLIVVYENGAIISAGGDASFNEESDGETFTSRRDGDMTYLAVGEERYEIPDAVIFGG